MQSEQGPGEERGNTGLTRSWQCKMARLAGLEPAAYGLEVRCSIQLSYRRLASNGMELA